MTVMALRLLFDKFNFTMSWLKYVIPGLNLYGCRTFFCFCGSNRAASIFSV